MLAPILIKFTEKETKTEKSGKVVHHHTEYRPCQDPHPSQSAQAILVRLPAQWCLLLHEFSHPRGPMQANTFFQGSTKETAICLIAGGKPGTVRLIERQDNIHKIVYTVLYERLKGFFLMPL